MTTQTCNRPYRRERRKEPFFQERRPRGGGTRESRGRTPDSVSETPTVPERERKDGDRHVGRVGGRGRGSGRVGGQGRGSGRGRGPGLPPARSPERGRALCQVFGVTRVAVRPKTYRATATPWSPGHF